MIYLIPATWPRGEVVKIEHPGEPSLAELRGWIGGGYIEIVEVLFRTKEAHMVCDEEGKLKGLPWNVLATGLYWTTAFATHDDAPMPPKDYVAGDVVLVTDHNRLT